MLDQLRWLVLFAMIIPLEVPGRVKAEFLQRKNAVEYELIEGADSDCVLSLEALDVALFLPSGTDVDQIRAAAVLDVVYYQTTEADPAISVLQLWAHGRLVYDASRCELHGVVMSREPLPAIFGLPTEEDFALYFGKIETYPHGWDVAFQGCLVPEEPYTHVNTYVCPVCRDTFLAHKQQILEEKDTAGASDSD